MLEKISNNRWHLHVNLPDISPASYFTTSGDALEKAEKLLKDCYSLARKACALRDKFKHMKGQADFIEVSGGLVRKVYRKGHKAKDDKPEDADGEIITEVTCDAPQPPSPESELE